MNIKDNITIHQQKRRKRKLGRYYSTISLCIILNMAFAWVAKIQAELSKYIGKGEVNISASIRAPHTKLFGGS